MSNPADDPASGRSGRGRRRDPMWEPIPRILSAMAVAFQVGLLVLFNVFPEWVGVATSLDESGRFIPILGLGFFEVLPWINASVGLGVALNLAHMAIGHWTPSTRWAEVGTGVFGCYVVYRLIHAGPLLSPAVDEALFGWPPFQTGPVPLVPVNSAVQALLWVILWISVAGVAINAIRWVSRTMRSV